MKCGCGCAIGGDANGAGMAGSGGGGIVGEASSCAVGTVRGLRAALDELLLLLLLSDALLPYCFSSLRIRRARLGRGVSSESVEGSPRRKWGWLQPLYEPAIPPCRSSAERNCATFMRWKV